MAKVAKEVAQADFERFASAIKLNQMKREKLEADESQPIESVINLIENGYVTIGEDGLLTYLLIEKVEKDGDIILSEVPFKPRRVRVEDIERRMTGKNDMEKTRNMLSFLTGVNAGILSKVDGDDFAHIGTISTFFLPR